jgi:hypothetical protein
MVDFIYLIPPIILCGSLTSIPTAGMGGDEKLSNHILEEIYIMSYPDSFFLWFNACERDKAFQKKAMEIHW